MEHKTVIDQVFQAFLKKLAEKQVLSNKGYQKLGMLLSAKDVRPELIKAALFLEDDVQ